MSKLALFVILCFAGGMCALGINQLANPRTNDIAGEIIFAQVSRPGKANRTLVNIHTPGGFQTLYASGTSNFFVPGQTIQAQYLMESKHILTAHFFSKDGEELGAFNSHEDWSPYMFLGLGGFIVIGAIARYRRDAKQNGELSLPDINQ